MSLVMRQKSLTRHSRATAWRNGMLALALAGTGLGTAFATVGVGKAPAPDLDHAVVKTIMRQRVAEGLAATPPAAETPAPSNGSAQPAMTRDTILAAVDSFEGEMKELITTVESQKKSAYAQKDIIRYNFLTTKLSEMKMLEAVVTPVIESIRKPGVELFVMQAKLSTIRQGLDQLRKSAQEAAAASNDGMDTGISAIDPAAAGQGTNDGVSDLPSPSTPTYLDPVGARPANASPYK